ncbi:MAG: sulfotransferase domain-containing protein [Actinomycetota bacterium]
MSEGDPVAVLYIGGAGRSGSTLLDRMLGQVPGACSLGEVVHLWARGVRDDERCGCGQVFSACPFWIEVGERAFGGWDRIEVEEVLALQSRVDRNRFIPLTITPWAAPGYRHAANRYGGYLERVFRAARDVSGAEVVIDSSKHASTAYVYRGVRGLDLRVVHLVRDARGVAYSWTKQVAKPEVVGRKEFMPRFGPAKAARWWLAFNALFDLLPVTGVPMMLLRYESLIREPREQTERVVRFARLSAGSDALGFVGPDTVQLAATHTVAGNPMRFETGPLALRLDEAWRQELPRGDLRGVELVTWPLLRRYGYEVRA